MGPFYFAIVSTYISGYISRITKNKKIISIFYGFLIFLVLVIIAGCRDGIGDTIMYKHTYSMMNNYKFDTKGEWGFKLINYLLYKINSNPQFLIAVLAFITEGLNIYNLYYYSSYLELEIYMYITMGYFTTTMNGIRQSLAGALVFSLTRLIEKGRTKSFIICVIFISTIHKSALILIPVYFIVRSKAWSKTTILVLISSCVVFFSFSTLLPTISTLLEGTNYGGYIENTNANGSSFIRVVVNMVPIILSYLKRDELTEKWTSSNIFINMSLINLIFVTFGMYNWIFNRFTIYFQLYNFILIPYIIANCLKGKEKKIVYYSCLICYFIFFYKEHVLGYNMHYESQYLNVKNIFYKQIGGE